MNSESLYEIAQAVMADVDGTQSRQGLAALSASLAGQVATPQEPTHQQSTSETLGTLRNALVAAPSNSFGPAWKQHLEEMGAADLLGNRLLAQLDGIFQRNQITVSVAQGEVDELHRRLEAVYQAFSQLVVGMDELELGSYGLEPGECELGFTIPRPAVKNELSTLGKEFTRLRQIVGPFQELAEGGRQEPEVRSISSSDFQLLLDLAPSVCALVGEAVNQLLVAYQNVLQIRKVQAELERIDAPDEAVDLLTQQASDSMMGAIDDLTDRILSEAANPPSEMRATEIRADLNHSLQMMSARIDVGYHIEVRFEPPEITPAEEGEEPEPHPDQDVFDRLEAVQPGLDFVHLEGPPVLELPYDEDDESGNGSTEES